MKPGLSPPLLTPFCGLLLSVASAFGQANGLTADFSSPTVVVNHLVPESAPPPPVVPVFPSDPTEADFF